MSHTQTKRSKYSLLALQLLLISFFVSIIAYSAYDVPEKPSPYKGDFSNIEFNSFNQKLIKKELLKSVDETQAQRGMVMLMDARSGAIESVVAIDKERQVPEDMAVQAYQPGSVIKPFILATAINENKVSQNDEYINPGFIRFDDRIITNVFDTAGNKLTTSDIIIRSLNTGAVSLLQSLSDNKDIDGQARNTWYNYMNEKFRFGKSSNLNIPLEQEGYMPLPSPREDIKYKYAGTSFGIGMTATPVQLLSAYAGLLNGGTYYQPFFKLKNVDSSRGAKVIQSNVVSLETSKSIVDVLRKTIEINIKIPSEKNGIIIGGKSGTAPSSDGKGGYAVDRDTGSYIGFIDTGKNLYVMIARLDQPINNRIASAHAANLWVNTMNGLVPHLN